MLDGHTTCVEEDQHYHEPVEPLCLNRVPYPKSESFLGAPESFATALVLDFRFKISCNKNKNSFNAFGPRGAPTNFVLVNLVL